MNTATLVTENETNSSDVEAGCKKVGGLTTMMITFRVCQGVDKFV
jgi:hypothetical protein